MKYVETEDNFFLRLSDSEERALAAWTFDLLASNWFDGMCGSVYKMVGQLFWRKCRYGYDLYATFTADLIDAIEKWNRRVQEDYSEAPDELKEKWTIDSSLLLPEENGKHRPVPLMNAQGREYTPEERNHMAREETRTIWREVWKGHERIQRSHERFLVFPGDDPGQGHRQVQEDKEKRFWDEVERRSTEWEVSRKEAEKLVADYMPRGDMSPSDRSEFEPPKSITDAMEFEIPEGSDNSSDFDYYFPETDPESDHF